MQKKLCIVANMASHYRKDIYGLLDAEYDCGWFFGPAIQGIKALDTSFLKDCHTLPSKNLPGSFVWRKGMIGLRRRYDTFLMSGETHCASLWAFLLLNTVSVRRKKVYLWTHGWYGKETKLEVVLKKLMYKMADGIFLYGEYARGLMEDEGIPADKLHVLHNSLSYNVQLSLRKSITADDIYRVHFCNSDPTIVFIGRLIADKKLHLLIEAAAILAKQGNPVNIVLIGDGPEKELLVKQAADNGLANRVWMYGACYDEQKNADLIANADLCVSPGNIGLTAIHSMMFGTPVASHNNYSTQGPEFESIKEGVTGFFFNPDDAGSIAEGIRKWFGENRDNRSAITENCYREIDTRWNPAYQMGVFRKVIK